MGVDRETKPKFLTILVSENQKYFKELRAHADKEGFNDEYSMKEKEYPDLLIGEDNHSLKIEEYYYDDSDSTLQITCTMEQAQGKTFFSIVMPLSDTVLIDILQSAIKRLNKLKTAMETLK